MNSKTFKPDKSMEMDLMKSILSDYSKFKQFYSLFGKQGNFWVLSINFDMFRYIKSIYENTGKPKNVNELTFYEWIFDSFQQKYAQYDLEVYEDFYEKGFDFERTLEHYAEYFKRREIIAQLEAMTEIFKSENEIDFSDVTERLKKIQGNLRKSEFWRLENGTAQTND